MALSAQLNRFIEGHGFEIMCLPKSPGLLMAIGCRFVERVPGMAQNRVLSRYHLLGKRSKPGKIREYETHRSESTEARDRGVKFEDYAVHGVGEYWIIDTESETVEQYLPGPDGYELKVKAATGTITSEVIAGLSLPVRAIFDKVENLAALRLLM